MIQAADIRKTFLLIAAMACAAVLAAGCSSDPGPVLCKAHTDCGRNQICRNDYCMDVFDLKNLCEMDSECPADSLCLTGACIPMAADGDDDGDALDADDGNDGDDSGDGDAEEPAEGEPEYSVNCDDGNSCTYDIYDGATCIHESANEGLPCDDYNTNTENDRCQQGTCKGDLTAPNRCCGEACVDCAEFSIRHGYYACIDEICEPACDNGYRLTAGVCAVFDCDDGNDCTLDQLNGETGVCEHFPLGNNIRCTVEEGVCSYSGECAEDQCGHLTLKTDCDDGVACTDDECDAVTGCTNIPNDSLCEQDYHCDATLGCVVTD